MPYSFQNAVIMPAPVYSVEEHPMTGHPKHILKIDRQRGGRRGNLASTILVVEVHHELAELVLHILGHDLASGHSLPQQLPLDPGVHYPPHKLAARAALSPARAIMIRAMASLVP